MTARRSTSDDVRSNDAPTQVKSTVESAGRRSLAIRAISAVLEADEIKEPKTRHWRRIARLASSVHGKQWSWRYIQSVHSGTLEASTDLIQALVAVAAQIVDDRAALLVDTAEALVFVRPGQDVARAIMSPGDALECARPGCSIRFISNHPARKFCYVCSPPVTKG